MTSRVNTLVCRCHSMDGHPPSPGRISCQKTLSWGEKKISADSGRGEFFETQWFFFSQQKKCFRPGKSAWWFFNGMIFRGTADFCYLFSKTQTSKCISSYMYKLLTENYNMTIFTEELRVVRIRIRYCNLVQNSLHSILKMSMTRVAGKYRIYPRARWGRVGGR